MEREEKGNRQCVAEQAGKRKKHLGVKKLKSDEIEVLGFKFDKGGTLVEGKNDSRSA